MLTTKGPQILFSFALVNDFVYFSMSGRHSVKRGSMERVRFDAIYLEFGLSLTVPVRDPSIVNRTIPLFPIVAHPN